MEADLQRFYGLDYRDRWRVDADGRRTLTLRRLRVLIRHLPPDAAVWQAVGDGKPRWELQHVLLAHIWQAAAQSKHPHPMLRDASREATRSRQQQRMTAERQRRIADARRRRRERLRAIQSGQIT